ncbi:MAG: hypothetical protein H8E73_02915 [Planctomycetes bacterium]|nr:hypothetical protein [Planctomycetota bacterium]
MTRCQIGIYSSKDKKFDEFDVLLCRHFDGCPGTPDGQKCGMLADIVPFLAKWVEVCGICDAERCGAQLLRFLCHKYDQIVLGEPYGDYSDFLDKIADEGSWACRTTHGISRRFHWNIHYFYKIYPNAVEVHAPRFNLDLDEPQPIFDEWQLLRRVSINEAADSTICPRRLASNHGPRCDNCTV